MRAFGVALLLLLAGCAGTSPADDGQDPSRGPTTSTAPPIDTTTRTDTTRSGTASPFRCPNVPGPVLLEDLLLNATMHGSIHDGWELKATICNNGTSDVTWTRDHLDCSIDWRLQLTDAQGTTRHAGWPGNAPNAGACATTRITLAPLETATAQDAWDGARWYNASSGKLEDAPPGDYTLTWTFQPDVYAPQTAAFNWTVMVE